MRNPAEVRPYEPLDAGTWRPLRRPVFRALWIATIASAVGTWIQDVGLLADDVACPHATPRVSGATPEDLFGAIRAGIRYVRHGTELKTVLVRALSFILCGSAPWALLPLFARKTLGLGPSGYGALLGCFGVGAVAGAFFLPRLRRATSAERLTTGAVLAFAAISLALGLTRNGKLVGLALGIGGAAWLILLSSLNLAAQSAVPRGCAHAP